MKSAINKKFLVNDCIVFSGVRNDDGDNVYYASLIKSVVRTHSGNKLFVSNNNVSLSNSDVCLFDSVLSKSTDKEYAGQKYFESATDDEKLELWTLRGNDSILITKKNGELPDIDYTKSMTEIDFRNLLTLWDIKKIKSVFEIQGFNGDILVRKIEIGE